MTRVAHFEAKYKDGLTDRINNWIIEEEDKANKNSQTFKILSVQVVWVDTDNYAFKGFVTYENF